MFSRSFVRAILWGAAAMLVALLAVAVLRPSAEEPQPPAAFDPAAFVRGRPKLDVPYVTTSPEVVDAMLGMAEVGPGDHVIDLGSGDGRILIAAARSNGARGLGVDIDPARIREARANARAARVAHRVEFRRQDLFETPLGEADVVTLYLLPEVNLRLRPRILAQMRPGTRVVSHDFHMGDWPWDDRRRIGTANVYLWIVPARVAGRWLLTVAGREARLDLEQRFQQVGGSVATGGRSAPIEQGRLAGARIRFLVDLGDGPRLFDGRVDGDRIEPLSADAGWRAVRAR